MIQLQNLTFRYKKDRELIENVNLQLEQGRIYGLLGKNGAGKTSLLKLVCGLLYPKRGTCSIDGVNSEERHPEALARMFFIPEEFELPSITVAKFIATNAVFYPLFSGTQMSAYLKEFEIEADVRLDRISFGQKKKFLIAFGLATNASVVVMDEPTNGLDIPSKSQFRKMLAHSIDESRMVIISTHQVRDLSQLIDHIVIIDNGEIIISQSIEEISNKFSFEHTKQSDGPDVLYSEAVLDGYSSICRSAGQHTEVDLELLFNAAIYRPAIIKQEFI